MDKVTFLEKSCIIILFLIALMVGFRAWSITVNMAVSGNSAEAGTFGGSDGVGIKKIPSYPTGMRKWFYQLISDERYSWASGSRVESIHRRMSRLMPLTTKNFAFPGHAIEDALYLQLPQIKQWSSDWGDPSPDFLIVALGENDVCADSPKEMTPIDQFHRDLESFVSSFPRSKILMVPIPDISTLYGAVHKKRNIVGMKAKTVWKWTGVCRTATNSKYNNAIYSRIVNLNYAIEDIARKYKASFASNVSRITISPKMVSRIDMFHPSEEGHELMAETAWPYMKELIAR